MYDRTRLVIIIPAGLNRAGSGAESIPPTRRRFFTARWESMGFALGGAHWSEFALLEPRSIRWSPKIFPFGDIMPNTDHKLRNAVTCVQAVSLAFSGMMPSRF